MSRPASSLRVPCWIVGLGALAACASTSSEEFSSLGAQRVRVSELAPDTGAPPPPPPPRRKVSLVDHAKTYHTAQACEVAARRMREVKPKKGWGLMRACAMRPDFTAIDTALRAPWLDEIRAHPRTGARMVSRLVANRGGNLKLDLKLVNDRGVQLFDLPTAMASGQVFRGRMVLMRGKLKTMSPVGPRTRLELAETTLEAQNIHESWRHYWQRRDKEWDRARSTRYSGGGRGSRARPETRNGYEIVDGDDGPKVTSVTQSKETKRYVKVIVDRMPKDLQLGEEYLFLVQFVGNEPGPDDEDAKKYARVDLVGHFEPLEDLP